MNSERNFQIHDSTSEPFKVISTPVTKFKMPDDVLISSLSTKEDLLKELQFVPANKEKAEQLIEGHKMVDDQNKPFSLFGTSLDQIGKYSIGVMLYLKTIQWVSFTFFIMSTITYPLLELYSEGVFLIKSQQMLPLDKYSISNLEGINPHKQFNLTQIDSVSDQMNQMKTQLSIQIYIDFAYSLVFFISLLIYWIWSTSDAKRLREKHYYLSDYSVYLHRIGLEPNNYEEILSYIQDRFGEIKDIVFIRDFARPYFDFKNYIKLLRKIRIQEIRCELKAQQEKVEVDLIESKDKILESLRKKEILLEASIKREYNGYQSFSDLPFSHAILTFQNISSQKKLIIDYKANQKKRLCLTLKKKWNGIEDAEFDLLARSEPELPENYQWQSFDLEIMSKILRTSVSLIIVIIFMLLVAGVHYGNSFYKTNNKKEPPCDNCSENKSTLQLKNLIIIGIALLIYAIQNIVSFVINSKGEFCLFQLKSTKLSFLSVVEALVLICNISITVLLVNLKIFANLIKLQKFYDFNRDWYQEVGSQIIVYLFINLGLHLVCPLLFNFFKNCICIKKLRMKGVVIQYDLLKIMKGSKVMITQKYGFLLGFTVVGILFTGPYPYLLLVLAIFFSIFYWIEKYKILHSYKLPLENYGPELNNTAMVFLLIGYFGHIFISFWMYTCPESFPDRFYFDVASNKVIFPYRSIMDRIFLKEVYILEGLFVFSFFICLLIFLKTKVLIQRPDMYIKPLDPTVEKTFDEVREKMLLKGLQSYDPIVNKKYSNVIKIMDEILGVKEDEETQKPNSAEDKAGNDNEQEQAGPYFKRDSHSITIIQSHDQENHRKQDEISTKSPGFLTVQGKGIADQSVRDSVSSKGKRKSSNRSRKSDNYSKKSSGRISKELDQGMGEIEEKLPQKETQQFSLQHNQLLN